MSCENKANTVLAHTGGKGTQRSSININVRETEKQKPMAPCPEATVQVSADLATCFVSFPVFSHMCRLIWVGFQLLAGRHSLPFPRPPPLSRPCKGGSKFQREHWDTQQTGLHLLSFISALPRSPCGFRSLSSHPCPVDRHAPGSQVAPTPAEACSSPLASHLPKYHGPYFTFPPGSKWPLCHCIKSLFWNTYISNASSPKGEVLDPRL